MSKDTKVKEDKFRYCKGCDNDVIPQKKMFGTLVCPDCHIIIDSPTMRQVQGN